MARLEARVNLRLPQDVFDTYQKVAEAFNTTVTEMIREIVVQGVEEMQIVSAVVDAAHAGDQAAAARLYGALMNVGQGRLDLARAFGDWQLSAEDDGTPAASSDQAETSSPAKPSEERIDQLLSRHPWGQ